MLVAIRIRVLNPVFTLNWFEFVRPFDLSNLISANCPEKFDRHVKVLNPMFSDYIRHKSSVIYRRLSALQ